MAKATERISWAVDMLAVQGDDRILEIGCGHGVTVSLVCEKLTSGTITAIDRSQTMIDMAVKRNQPCIAAGKANFRCVALEKANFGDERFDKIFAIRVNFFIQQPAVQLPVLKGLLKPTGALYLFYDPPVASQLSSFIERAKTSLQAHGFAVEKVVTEELAALQGVCVVAVPQN